MSKLETRNLEKHKIATFIESVNTAHRRHCNSSCWRAWLAFCSHPQSVPCSIDTVLLRNSRDTTVGRDRVIGNLPGDSA